MLKKLKKLLLNKVLFVVLIIVLIETGVLVALVLNKHQEKRVENYPEQYPFSCVEPKTMPGNCSAVEDAGKVKVAERVEVKSLVRQYGRKGVIIKALEFKDVNDQEFMQRLLGDKYVELGCIIYVEYPGGQYVYLEDDKLDVINRLDGTQFYKWLQSASKEDQDKFYSHLR